MKMYFYSLFVVCVLYLSSYGFQVSGENLVEEFKRNARAQTIEKRQALRCYFCKFEECDRPLDQIQVMECAENQVCAFHQMKAKAPELPGGQMELYYKACQVPVPTRSDGCVSAGDYISILRKMDPSFFAFKLEASGGGCYCNSDLCNNQESLDFDENDIQVVRK